jgi:hypothetical protein
MKMLEHERQREDANSNSYSWCDTIDCAKYVSNINSSVMADADAIAPT